MPACIAYREDGRICGRPGTFVDDQRGGVVCPAHKPQGPREERTCERCSGLLGVMSLAAYDAADRLCADCYGFIYGGPVSALRDRLA